MITPKGYAPAPDVIADCQAFAAAAGSKLTITTDLAAIEGHDAVYTDVWVSMGQAGGVDEVTKRRKVFTKYRVSAERRGPGGLHAAAHSLAVFMHCLPAQRGLEVTDDVIDSANSVVYDQAENRMHAQNALLHYMIRGAAFPNLLNLLDERPTIHRHTQPKRKSVMSKKRIALAYSGGLDTSCIVPWLRENIPGAEVICVVGNVGQGSDDPNSPALRRSAKDLHARRVPRRRPQGRVRR